MFHLTDLIEASLVEPGESVLHGGKPVRVWVVHPLLPPLPLQLVHIVVAGGGGGGEAVRGADRVGRALRGQARHRPQPHHHRVRLLERSQRVSNLCELFGPGKKYCQSQCGFHTLHCCYISHVPSVQYFLPVSIPVGFLGSCCRSFGGI